MSNYNAYDNAAIKIAFAREQKTLPEMIDELEWRIQFLKAIDGELSTFGEEVLILRAQIEKWNHEYKQQKAGN